MSQDILPLYFDIKLIKKKKPKSMPTIHIRFQKPMKDNQQKVYS